MYRKDCRCCKHFRNGICQHEDMISKDSFKDAIIEHVDIAFDGDIQSKLQETIEQYCKDLNDTEKEDLIESISTVCRNHLTDESNMYLEDEGFSPPDDFFCMNWE